MSTLYSNLKFLRYTKHIEAIRDQSIVAPVHIRIKPINRCNHNCWYCAYRVSNLHLGEEIDYKDTIPEAKMFEIVDDVIDMGVKAVTFSGGGEPLLYKQLPAVVKRLSEGGVRVAALTNGSKLKGKVAEAFAEYGTWIRVSNDAWDDASFAKSRGIREGEFSKLLQNMTEFSERSSNCVLGVSYIVDENNCHHAYDACKLFKNAGVNHVKFSGVVVSNSGKENNAYHAKIRDIVTEQIERTYGLADEKFSVINHYHDLDDPAKMIVDVLLHPGMNLTDDHKRRFFNGILQCFSDYPRLVKRVKVVYPLFGLKWCLILLNEFLPEELIRRQFAGMKDQDLLMLQVEQLSKAKHMLQNIGRNYEHFPYFN